ncbi:MAG: S26 family signal peptidase [Candidatus Wildermuthbacteria bacterium]|nr:S26 family signal peptidase [Candidatus Wildermuthbacteria bacterium]
MEPGIPEGSFVLVNRLAYIFSKPKIGDAVALKHPLENRLLIKRIAGEEKKNGHNVYWVKGDNPGGGIDSGNFGWAEEKLIAGKILYVFRKPK